MVSGHSEITSDHNIDFLKNIYNGLYNHFVYNKAMML